MGVILQEPAALPTAMAAGTEEGVLCPCAAGGLVCMAVASLLYITQSSMQAGRLFGVASSVNL